MKVSEIVKGGEGTSRIVKYRASRSTRKRADLLESITKDVSELQALSRGLQSAEGLDVETAINDVAQAVSRLKAELSL